MPPQADNEQGGTTMRTHESQEMYLETILLLRMRKSNVRSVDIVEELGYAKSSVSRAVNLLQDAGFIRIDAMWRLTHRDRHDGRPVDNFAVNFSLHLNF